jgi:hypothetical protein
MRDVHWSTWIGCNIAIGVLSFIVAETIQVFNYILSLEASMSFALMTLMFPAFFWMLDHRHHRTGSLKQKLTVAAHVWLACLATFMVVGGT